MPRLGILLTFRTRAFLQRSDLCWSENLPSTTQRRRDNPVPDSVGVGKGSGYVEEGQSITHRLSKPSTGPAALVSRAIGTAPEHSAAARERPPGERRVMECCDPVCHPSASSQHYCNGPRWTSAPLGETRVGATHELFSFLPKKGEGRVQGTNLNGMKTIHLKISEYL